MTEGQKNFLTFMAAIVILAITGGVVFVIIQQQDKQELVNTWGEDYLSICNPPPSGEQTRQVPGSIGELRALLLPMGGDEPHDWQDQMPQRTRATSRADLDVIVCVGDVQQQLLERCQYFDTGTREYVVAYDRKRAYVPVKLVRPQTGELIAEFSAVGTEPPPCASQIKYEQAGVTEELRGGSIGFNEFYAFTRSYLRDYGP